MTDPPSMSTSSIGASGSSALSEVALRVAVKSRDAAKAEGESAVALIESAAKVQEQAQSLPKPEAGRVDTYA